MTLSVTSRRVKVRLTTAGATLAAVVLASCTFALRDPTLTSACGAIEYEINSGEAGEAQVSAVQTAVDRFGTLVDREVTFIGLTDASNLSGDGATSDSILIEFDWPTEVLTRFGFAQATIEAGRYVGGFIYLHPMMNDAPPEIIERLTMHELGHLAGLADVDAIDEIMNPALTTNDWGAGDIVGLHLAHSECH